jgi:acylphosphatase
VQGVGFRWHARERARELELSGWIANLADGRVEMWAQGAGAKLDALEAWLHRGPPAARVERVIVERGAAASFHAPSYDRIAW